MVKDLPANAGDSGSIPGSGRSPGEGNGSPLQYSCLETYMDRGAWCMGPKELDTTEWLTDQWNGEKWSGWTYLQDRNKDRDTENDLWTQWGMERVGQIGSSTDLYTRPCVKQIARGKQLHSPGSSRCALWWLRGVGWGVVGGRLKREGLQIHL